MDNSSLHRYGHGPFCQFRIAQEDRFRRGGVYAILCNDAVKYVGECVSLAASWNQIGNIRPSAVRPGGQQTHCRINTALFNEISQGVEASLWFLAVDDRAYRREVKLRLTGSLNPSWNLQGVRNPSRTYGNQTVSARSRQKVPQDNEIVVKVREFGGLSFTRVGRIQPELDSDGSVVEFMPQSRYANPDSLPLNRYGHGPFCRFSIAKGNEWQRAGVYVLAHGDRPLYVGQCIDMRRRWGSIGYGHISPRACFKGGQETNCRINNLILQGVNISLDLDLWFRPIVGDARDRETVEGELIGALRPPWNR